jgi:hypothetical protein
VLTVSTNSSIVGALRPQPFGSQGESQPGTILVALLFLPLAFTRRARKLLRRHAAISIVLCLASLIGLGALSGCSGASTPAAASTTPAGSYTIGITLTGAPAGTAALNLQINVQ